MGEHDTLGIAGGARSIDKRGQILWLDVKLRSQRSISTPLAVAAAFSSSDERVTTRACSPGPGSGPSPGCAQVRLAANGGDLAVLCFAGDDGDARARID